MKGLGIPETFDRVLRNVLNRVGKTCWKKRFATKANQPIAEKRGEMCLLREESQNEML